MSEHRLKYIPTDCDARPSPEAAHRAVELLRSFVPQALGEVSATYSQERQFHFGVRNHSGVSCPACGTDIQDWWDEAMNKAFASSYIELSVTMPCCGASTTLNNLDYAWPAGFSKFVLEAIDPRIDETHLDQDEALSRVLGLELRKIWVHT